MKNLLRRLTAIVLAVLLLPSNGMAYALGGTASADGEEVTLPDKLLASPAPAQEDESEKPDDFDEYNDVYGSSVDTSVYGFGEDSMSFLSAARAAGPTYDETAKVFYAYGVPITIKEVSGQTNVYRTADMTPLAENIDAAAIIYGGGSASSDSIESAKITMESGTVEWIYGGGAEGSVGNTEVIINGGNITKNVYGGGRNAGSSVLETASVTVNGGTIGGGVFGGGENGSVTTSSVVVAAPVAFACGGGFNKATVNASIVVKSSATTVYAGGYKASGTKNISVDVRGESRTKIGSVKQLICGDGVTGSSSNVTITMQGGRVVEMYAGYHGTVTDNIIGGHIVTPKIKLSGPTVPVKILNASDNYNAVLSAKDSGKDEDVRISLRGESCYSKLSEEGTLTLYLAPGTWAANGLIVAIQGGKVFTNTGEALIMNERGQNSISLRDKGESGYVVTFGAKDNAGGTVTAYKGSDSIAQGAEVNSGTVISFTAAPNDGYKILHWWRDGEIETSFNTSDTTVSWTVTDDVNVEAEFVREGTVTYSANPAGSCIITPTGISGSGESVPAGTTLQFTHGTPNGDYVFVSWLVNGERVAANATGGLTYTTDGNAVEIQAECVDRTALNALLEAVKPMYDDLNTTNTNYSAKEADINAFRAEYDTAKAMNGQTTLTELTAPAQDSVDDEIAKLKEGIGKILCKVVVNPTVNGSVTVSPTEATWGTENITLTVKPDAGYVLDTLTAVLSDNKPVTLSPNPASGDEEGTYTFTMPGSYVTVNATFKTTDGYIVTYSAGTDGGITANPAGTDGEIQNVKVTDTVTFTATANDNYSVDTWTVTQGTDAEAVTKTKTVDGQTKTDTYTLTGVTDNTTVAVSFKQNQHELTIERAANGEILVDTDKGGVVTGSTNLKGKAGDTITLKTGTVANGYSLTKLFYVFEENSVETKEEIPLEDEKDESDNVTRTALTFTMPDRPIAIRAEFTANDHTVTYQTAGETNGGTITARNNTTSTDGMDGTVQANYNNKIVFTVTPKPGYILESVKYKENGAADSTAEEITANDVGQYELTMPDHSVTVTATFARKELTITKVVTPTGGGTLVVLDSEGNEVTGSPLTAKIGDAMTVKVTPTTTETPRAHYELKAVTLTYQEGSKDVSKPITIGADGTGTFTMPGYPVTVTAEFVGLYGITVQYNPAGTPPEGAGTAIKVNNAEVTETKAGDAVTVTPWQRAGYDPKQMVIRDTESNLVGTESVNVDGNFTFTMPAKDVTLEIIYEAKGYTITKTAGTGGTIDVTGNAKCDEEVTFTVTAEPGYTISDGSVKVIKTGSNPEESVALTSSDVNDVKTSGSYSFTMPAYDVTVKAEFVANQSTVTYNAGDHGKIEANPAGTVTTADKSGEISPVEVTNTIAFTATADGNYSVEKWTITRGTGSDETVTDVPVDGQLKTATYELKNVTADTKVDVSFKQNRHLLTVEPSTNGTIAVDTTNGTELVNGELNGKAGDTITLNIKAGSVTEGYKLAQLYYNYMKDGQPAKEPITFEGVTEITFTMPDYPVTIHADFTINTHTVTYQIAGETNGGTIIARNETKSLDGVDGTIPASFRDNVVFTVTPNPGYKIKTVMYQKTGVADDTPQSLTKNDLGKYPLTMPDYPVTVTVTFEKDVLGITTGASPAVGGSVKVLSVNDETIAEGISPTAKIGSTVKVEVTTNTSYLLKAVTFTYQEDGKDVSTPITLDADGTGTFTMPGHVVTVKAEFVKLYGITVQYKKGADGTLTADTASKIKVEGTELTGTKQAKAGDEVIVLPGAIAGYTQNKMVVRTGGADGKTETLSPNEDKNFQFTMPEKDVALEIAYEPEGYAITPEVTSDVGTGGTITVAESANCDKTVTFTVTAKPGYTINDGSVKVVKTSDGSTETTVNGADGSYSFTMPAYDVTVKAEFTAIRSEVTYNNGGNGSLAVTKNDEVVTDNPTIAGVTVNDKFIFTATADANHCVDTWTIKRGDGTPVTETVDGQKETATYTLTDVTANTTVSVTFKQKQHQLTIKNFADGVESSAKGTIAVADDESDVVSGGEYWNGKAGSDITLKKAGVADGYELTELYYGYPENSGETTVAIPKDTLTFNMPDRPITIYAKFAIKTYTATYEAVPETDGDPVGGTITARSGDTDGVGTSIEVVYSKEVVFTVTPEPGYELKSVQYRKTGDTVTTPETMTANNAGKYSLTMPNYDVTVTATFAKKELTITAVASPADGATLKVVNATGTEITTAKAGETVTVEVTPGTNYEMDTITYTSAEGSGTLTKVADGKYSFTMPAGNVTVTAAFTKLYTITVEHNLTPDTGKSTVCKVEDTAVTKTRAGKTVIVSPALKTGYVPETMAIKGHTNVGSQKDVALNGDGKFEFEMPAEDVTLTITYTPRAYKITTAAGTGGTIAVTEKATQAKCDETVKFTVEPDDGYSIKKETVDSVEKDVVKVVKASDGSTETTLTKHDDGSYSFTMPAYDVTIKAEFAAKEYTITYSAEPGGTGDNKIKANSEEPLQTGGTLKTTVADTVTFTAIPVAHYSVEKWTITPASGEAITVLASTMKDPTEYVLKNVTADTDVKVTFKQHTNKITLAPTTNGTIAVKKDANVTGTSTEGEYIGRVGNTITVEVTPNTGYRLTNLEYRSVVNSTVEIKLITENDGSNTFEMPDKDITIYAEFAEVESIIEYGVAGTGGGTISAKTSGGTTGTVKDGKQVITVKYGETVTFTAKPSDPELQADNASRTEYKIGKWSVGGTEKTENNGNETYTYKQGVDPIGGKVEVAFDSYTTYKVTLKKNVDGGTVSIGGAEWTTEQWMEKNKPFTVTVTLKDGCEISDFIVGGVSKRTDGVLDEATHVTSFNVTLPDSTTAETKVEVVFNTPETLFDVTVGDPAKPIEHGTIETDLTQSKATGLVKITVNPATGYKLKEGTLKAVQVKKNNDGTYTKVDGAAEIPVKKSSESEKEYSFQMPKAHVRVTGEFEKVDYAVKTTATPADGGSFTVVVKDAEDPTKTKTAPQIGDSVTVTITPTKNGAGKVLYELLEVVQTVDIPKTDPQKLTPDETDGTYSFIMPAADVEVTAKFAGRYTVKLPTAPAGETETIGVKIADKNGTPAAVTPDNNEVIAKAGQYVIITAQKPGYTPKSLKIYNTSGEILLQPAVLLDNGHFQFEMPNQDVTLKVEYQGNPIKIKREVTSDTKENGGGTITVVGISETGTVNCGETVTLTMTADDGFTFKEAGTNASDTTYGVTLTYTKPDDTAATERIEKTGGAYSFKVPVVKDGTDLTVKAVFAAEPVVITAIPEKTGDNNKYTYTFKAGGTALAIKDGTTGDYEAKCGQTVNVTVTPAGTYKVTALTYRKTGAENAAPVTVALKDVEGATDNSKTGSFVMPSYPVTFTAVCESIKYTITDSSTGTALLFYELDPATNMRKPDPAANITEAVSGTLIEVVSGTETIIDNSVKVNGGAVTVSSHVVAGAKRESIPYTFIMPGENVTVTANFVGETPTPEVPEVTPGGGVEENTSRSYSLRAASSVANDGTVSAKVTAAEINTALQQAAKDADGKVNLTFNADTGNVTVDTVQKVSFTLPAASVQNMAKAENNVGSLTVNTPEGVALAMDSDAMAALSSYIQETTNTSNATGKNVEIVIEPADESVLTGTAAETLAGRPVYTFEVLVDGEKVTRFDKTGGKLTLSIPYELKEGETASNVTACYIQEDGKVELLLDSTYDEESQVVIFTTPHLSAYGVAYRQSRFADIMGHWAQDDIFALEMMGLVNGVTATEFMPDRLMERGMLVTVLGRMAGASGEPVEDTGFTDVPVEAYYASYAAWAKANAIAFGTGNGQFSPGRSITREELAVMLYRYAQLQQADLPEVAEPELFADDASISPWAREAVYVLRETEVLEGMGDNTYEPQGSATRAQVSKMLLRLLELLRKMKTGE